MQISQLRVPTNTLGITGSSNILLAMTLASGLALAADAAGSQPDKNIESAVAAVVGALPRDWVVVDRSGAAFPYGHHYCGKYDGIRGTKLTVAGPRAIAVHWTTEAGEARRTNAAVEALELWFMPAAYRDSAFAWLCFNRPVQPVEVLSTDYVRVFGRATHRLEPREVFLREVLPKASSIAWPDSPATNPKLISWSNWAQQLAATVAGDGRRP